MVLNILLPIPLYGTCDENVSFLLVKKKNYHKIVKSSI